MRHILSILFIAAVSFATAQTTDFREVEVPATILGQSGGELNASQLGSIVQLDAPENHRIVNCQFSQVMDGQVYIKMNDGSLLNDEIKHRITQTAVGESIYFENIIAQDAKGEKVKLPHIKLTVVE